MLQIKAKNNRLVDRKLSVPKPGLCVVQSLACMHSISATKALK